MTPKPTYEQLLKKVTILEARGALSDLREAPETPDGRLGFIEEIGHYAALFDDAAVVIFATDARGKLQYISRNVESALGHDCDSMLGKPFLDFIWPDDRDAVQAACQAAREKSDTSSFECRVCDFNDNPQWVKTVGRRVMQDGHFTGLRGVLVDITERIQAEKEKKALEAQLFQAQKMETIAALVGGIAHDFNNILMGILENNSQLMSRIDDQDPFFRRIERIDEFVQSGTRLTRQLLGYARRGKGEIRATDITRILIKTARMFGQTKKDIAVYTRNNSDVWMVDVDRGQMEQVMLNLYVNAAQAMKEGGDLNLTAENVHIDENFRKPYKITPGRYVRISVTDSGEGIPKEIRDRIFEPFFTTKEKNIGTGLGLASVFGIVKNHGGFIDVYSEIGVGTTFAVYLPASDKAPSPAVTTDRTVQRGSEMILLVDDEEVVIRYGRRMLTQLGYAVFTARSGMEALHLLKANFGKIDLTILDLILPDAEGTELFEEIQNIDDRNKVLLTSGYHMNSQIRELLDKGCHGFIQKPFNLLSISQKIRQIIDG